MVDQGLDIPGSSVLSQAYSKRELTYDSDVLRAMEGVFGFYAQLEPSVEQCWGLPLRWTGFAKRNGFPTWSWSGWKVGVRWNFLENVEHLEKSFTAPLFVETTTGGLVQLNNALARLLTSGQSYAALGLTYILRITTEVFDVPFIECEPYRPTITWEKSDSFPTRRKGQHWVTKEDYPHEGIWTHFVVQKNIGASERGLVWPLDLTHGGAATSSDLAFGTDTINLKPMTLRCIVISYDYGMIVQCSNGISKRVGLLRFEGEFFENDRASKELLAFSIPAAIAPDCEFCARQSHHLIGETFSGLRLIRL
ncbi:hypothetical protein DER44DRAFT_806377 [Fusarium oxysporum]|nr:hypothetical protein DER44DRAFT_806377 [Fusarium oxysporum]